MIRNLVFEFETAKPAIAEMKFDLLAQPPLEADAAGTACDRKTAALVGRDGSNRLVVLATVRFGSMLRRSAGKHREWTLAHSTEGLHLQRESPGGPRSARGFPPPFPGSRACDAPA